MFRKIKTAIINRDSGCVDVRYPGEDVFINMNNVRSIVQKTTKDGKPYMEISFVKHVHSLIAVGDAKELTDCE